MELMDLFIDGFYYFYFIILFYSLFNPILPYITLYSTITIEDIKWKLKFSISHG